MARAMCALSRPRSAASWSDIPVRSTCSNGRSISTRTPDAWGMSDSDQSSSDQIVGRPRRQSEQSIPSVPARGGSGCGASSGAIRSESSS